MAEVSVILPVYNRKKYIGQSIRSVLSQTFNSLELVIVDDGSTDGTRDVIDYYRNTDSRVKAVYRDGEMGVSAARNLGIQESSGEFVSFIDSDDLWVPDKLEKQMQIARSNPNTIVWSESNIIDSDGNMTGITFTDLSGSAKIRKSGFILSELLKYNFISTLTLLIRKDALSGVAFDENLKISEDYKLELQLASQYRFHFISEPLAYYRVYEGNSYNGVPRLSLSSDIYVLKYIIKNFKDKLKLSAFAYRFIVLLLTAFRLPPGHGKGECIRTLLKSLGLFIGRAS